MIKTPTRMAVLLLLGLVTLPEYAQAADIESDAITKGLVKSKSETNQILNKVQRELPPKHELLGVNSIDLGAQEDIEDLINAQEESLLLREAPKNATTKANDTLINNILSSILSKYKATPASKVTEEVEQVPTEAKYLDNLSATKKVEKKDNEQIEITSEGANDSTVGNDLDISADLDANGEVSTEGKLEQEIEQQAKQILDQQMKLKGNGQMSAAAAALNKAEMGIKV